MKIILKDDTIITVPSQKTEYIVGCELLENLHQLSPIKNESFSSFLVLTDDNVFRLYGRKVISSLRRCGKPVVLTKVEQGEKSKNLSVIPKIIKPFLKEGFNRNACLITLGGGVVTDLGGFLGSIMLRGLKVIHLPTSLLGQIDAAIGGKSAVDVWIDNNLMLKNMLGSIDQPEAVIADVSVLATLPQKEIRNGLGEIVKYWVGWGKPSINQISNIKDQKDKKNLSKVIAACQKIKLDIIKKDPFETRGIRQKLNLGHTLGHAIEGATDGKLSHGESVSLGLAAAARISVLTGLLSNEKAVMILEVIQTLGLPTKIKGINKNIVLQALKSDKKNGTFVLIKDIGKLITGMNVDKKLIKKVLSEIII